MTLLGTVEQNAIKPSHKSDSIKKPSKTKIAALYQAIRNSTIDPSAGNLIFSDNYPRTQELREVEIRMKCFYPEDRLEAISSQFASDWTYMLAEYLSEEKVIFLPRIWTNEVVTSYIQEYSIIEARNFVHFAS